MSEHSLLKLSFMCGENEIFSLTVLDVAVSKTGMVAVGQSGSSPSVSPLLRW